MKNVILLLLFILALSSCTIEKRRYFKGYHVALRQAQGPGKKERGEEGKRESAQEQQSAAQQCAAQQSTASNNEKPQRGDIVIESEIVLDDIAMDDIAKIDETPKPQRGDIIIEDIAITSPESVTTANAQLPIPNTGQARGHKKSHALEGLGTIFFLGIITLVVIVALLLYIFTDSAVFAVIGSLLLGLVVAIGIYLLLMILFFALLFLIISSFGS